MKQAGAEPTLEKMRGNEGWRLALVGLLLSGCAGRQSRPDPGAGDEAGDRARLFEALASGQSEPLRVGRVARRTQTTDGSVGAARGQFDGPQGWLQPQTPRPLLESLLERGVFRSFSAMLLATDLEAELGSEPHTIFVPNDQAFQLLSLETRLYLFELGDTELMVDLMRRHVVRGAYSAGDIAKAGELTTLAGTRIRVEAIGGMPVIDGAQLLSSRSTEAGPMHELDRVLY